MKTPMVFILIFSFLLTSAGLRPALSDPDTAPPPNITELHDRLTDINRAMDEASGIPLPPRKKMPEPQPPMATMPTADQVIDNVIPADKQQKTMDLEFDEVPLENILRTIGDAAQINIVLDPTLKSMAMPLHLRNVTIKDALFIMADSYNLAFKQIGNSLFVTTKERMRGDHLVTKVINLRYIKASGVKTLTHNLLDTVTFYEDNNSLVITGTPQEVAKVEEVVKRVDVSQPQVVLEARIIEVNKDALKDLGVDWSDTLSTSFQESGRPKTFSTTENPSQNPFRISTFSRSPFQFDAAIKMLENSNKAKVLSNPRIITLNNKESEIFVGDRIPYTVSTTTGGGTTTDVRFVEPGIRLRITPSIIDNEFVVVKIEPEVSFIFTFLGPQAQYPWIKTRNATAFVRIQNNQPFVLGGLLNQEDKKNLYKVPGLGDIPGFGKLFSYQKHTVTDSELIIMVTPTIINQ